MIFSSLDLAPELQKALDLCGYTQMTDIQQQAIVPARRGTDILANAQTGTGKTAAFALPILQQMFDRPKVTPLKHARALILTPTRELAEQLAETIGRYAEFLPLSVTSVYGGVKMGGQQRKLAAGVDILIATPGRLLEHLDQNSVSLSKVEFVVLDEADRMLDMGFITDVQSILQQVPKKRQSMLYSATISQGVNELAHKLLHKHQVISAAKKNATATTVEHSVYPVEERRKTELFVELIEEKNWFQVLVFTSTKSQADALNANLKQVDIKAVICHGDKSQGTRRRALADFKAGKVQVMIATEVAARGLDIQGLEHVVNFNLPYLAEDYVHRIGRTGRAGSKGQAISFVSRKEERALNSIERLIGSAIPRVVRRGYEVGSRETLVKTLEDGPRRVAKNKASESEIGRKKNVNSKKGFLKPKEGAGKPKGEGKSKGSGKKQGGKKPKKNSKK